MSKEKKKPDLVAWNEERGYYSKELTYGSNIGAPAIRLDDIGGWKQGQVQKANKVFVKKYDELIDKLQELVDEVKWNEFVYSAKYSFIPIVGETYFIYKNKADEIFLSLINPSEWSMEFIGATRLESNSKWIKI